jgi:hypothetical protein
MASSSSWVLATTVLLAGGCQLLSGLADYQTRTAAGGTGAQGGGGGTGGGLPPGQSCLKGSECASGFCVNEVCCQDPCDGPCAESCNHAGHAGICWLVTPGKPANCDAGLCDTSGECAVGAWAWTRRFVSGDQPDVGPFVAIDPADNGDPVDNVLLAGSYDGEIYLESASSSFDSDGAHFFLAKLRDTGDWPSWAASYGGSSLPDLGSETVTALAVRAGGKIAVAGRFNEPFNMDGKMLAPTENADNAFLAVLDDAGACQWAIALAATGLVDNRAVVPQAIAFDDQERVHVAGVFRGGLKLADQAALTSALGPSIFVAAYDGAGTFIRAERYGGTSEALAVGGLAASGDGDLVLTGTFDATLAFVDTKLTAAGGDPGDAFVAWLKLGGDSYTLAGAVSFGGAGLQQPAAVARDGDGSAVIAGSFQGKLADEGPCATAKGTDVFVRKMAPPQGLVTWQSCFGSDAEDHAHGVAVDNNGNFVLAGDYGADITIGKQVLEHVEGADGFVAKFAQDAETASDIHPLWAQRLYGTANQLATGVAVAPGSGAVFVTGYVEDVAMIGGKKSGNFGDGPDPFVARFGP